MERTMMKELDAWKSRPRRKPLLLRGARQTGKTWLLKELGRSSFQSMAYVDLLETFTLGKCLIHSLICS